MMYIPEFWCGVIATIVIEFLLMYISSLFLGGYEDETTKETD